MTGARTIGMRTIGATSSTLAAISLALPLLVSACTTPRNAAAPPETVALPADLELLDRPVRRQFETALEALDRARSAEAGLGAAYGELGRLLQAYGYLDEARGAYRLARHHAPG